MQARRRAGLRSFPGQPPEGSACPASDPSRSAQPRVLGLKILQSLDLVALEPAKLLAPAVVGHLRHANRTNRVSNALTLRDQHVDLAQLRNDLLRLVSLPRHRGPPWLESHTSGRTASKGEDHTGVSPATLCFV